MLAARSVFEGKIPGSLIAWCEDDRRWSDYFGATIS